MKRTTSLILAFILLAAAAILPAGASADNKGGFTKSEVTAYLFSKEKTDRITCLFFDELPDVPYISAEDYLNCIYTVEFTTVDNHNGTYTVKSDNGEMLVDPSKDTVHFDNFEDLIYYDSVDANEEESAYYIDDDSESEPIGKVKGVDLDLSEYDLDLVSDDGKVYFPLYTISDIFSDVYLSAIYRNQEIYFIRSQDEEPYYDNSEIFNSSERDKAMIDFTYNELCFSIDHFYGAPPKAEISEDLKEKGFDAAIQSHDSKTARARELLKSDSRVDFCKGLLLLDNYFSDGGHTMLSGGLLFSNKYNDSALYNELIGLINNPDSDLAGSLLNPITELSLHQEISDSISAARETAFQDAEVADEWDDAKLYQKDKTLYFVFDEFKDSVVKHLSRSLKYADSHDFENFVVDLTTNGGGSQAVVYYMLSVLTGDSTLYETNTFTGNRTKSTPAIDKNLDKKFNAEDEKLKYDLNFAILTSKASFSSANMLPCIAKTHGVAIIGETSGGGTCALAIRYMPDGSYYYMSSDMMMTYADGSDIDAGAEPDTELDTDNNYQNFFDFKKINDGIADYYSNDRQAETESDEETEAPTEASTEATEATEAPAPFGDDHPSELAGRSRSSDLMILFVVFGVMTALLITIIILIVILIRSRKNPRNAPKNPAGYPTYYPPGYPQYPASGQPQNAYRNQSPGYPYYPSTGQPQNTYPNQNPGYSSYPPPVEDPNQPPYYLRYDPLKQKQAEKDSADYAPFYTRNYRRDPSADPVQEPSKEASQEQSTNDRNYTDNPYL